MKDDRVEMAVGPGRHPPGDGKGELVGGAGDEILERELLLQAQQTAVEKLAAQYDKPDYATPLGMPEVPYYCSANPSATLGYFFSHAQD